MPSNIGRTLHLCFSKLNRSRPINNNNNDHNTNINQSPSPPPSPSSSSSSTTTTATVKDHRNSSSLVVMKNFNSLYDFTTSTSSPYPTTSNSLSSSTTDFFSTSSSSDNFSDATDPTTIATSLPDITAVFSSQRFFFSFPGRSNSIFDSINHSSSSSLRSSSISQLVVAGGVPFQTYSPDPFSDFRRSMQEMVEARNLLDVRANWDGLHELLSCYLDLNPKHIHKFIIGAFADLLLSLLATTSSDHTRTSTVAVACPESDVVSTSTTNNSRCEISLQLV